MSLANHTKLDGTVTPSGPTTLHSLLDALGTSLLRVLVAPRGVDVPVRCTAIFEPDDPMSDQPDGVLLLAGTRADGPLALDAVQAAARHGFVAVVVKLRAHGVSELVATASTHGLAVLATDDDLPWRQLDGLMASVLGAGRLPSELPTREGEALFALANALSAIIGGSVAIEDLEQQVLGYSSIEGQLIDPLRERGILDRRVPDYPHHRAQYLNVLQRTGVTRFPAVDGELPRAAVAVRAGDLPLGTIWAIEGPDGLRPDGEQALLDGARIAALHLLVGQDGHEREQRLRGEVLRSALTAVHSTPEAADRLGLTVDAEYSLIAFALVDRESVGAVPRMANAIVRYVAAYRPEAITTTTPRAVYVLAPGSEPAARRLAEGVLPTLARSADVAFRGAVSAASRDLGELPHLRREVDAVLRAAAADSHAPVVATVTDVHTRLLLDQLSDLLVRDPRLRHPGIEQLTAHDAEHATDYSATVLAWLDAESDVRRAAQMLSVHPNTLRYRLRRIQERFALDLADPDVRLSAWLQLRAVEASTSRP